MDKIAILTPEINSASKITWESTPRLSLGVSDKYRCILATLSQVLSGLFKPNPTACCNVELHSCMLPENFFVLTFIHII